MPKYCPECGKKLIDKPKFCPECGEEIIDEKFLKSLEPERAKEKSTEQNIDELIDKKEKKEKQSEFKKSEETSFREFLKNKIIIGMLSFLSAFLIAFLSGAAGGIPIPWYSDYSQSGLILFIDVIILTVIFYFIFRYVDIKVVHRTDKKSSSKKRKKKEVPVKSTRPKSIKKEGMVKTKKLAIIIPILIIVFVALFFVVDADGDGLNNLSEIQHGTAMFNSDSDSDGLNDGDEINIYDTDPLNDDCDYDGISDGEEKNTYGTDPMDGDTDDDGLDDYAEIYTYQTNPLSLDSDSDGLNDGDEINIYDTDPLDEDYDNDGLNDGDEVELGTDLFDTDTDNDGIEDGSDSNPTIHDWKLMDSDNDGWSDYKEHYEEDTDRFNSDTDGDGAPDGYDANPMSVAQKIRRDFDWEYPKGKTWTLTSYISHDLYVYYSGLDRIQSWSGWSQYTIDPTIENIAENLEDYAKGENLDYYQTVNFLIAFVESLPYELDSSTTDLSEYPRYPTETFVVGAGDCEDTSILFSSILREMNYDNCLVVFTSPVGHAMIGVWGHSDYQGSYSMKNGKNYYFCETTGEEREMGYLNSIFSSSQAKLYHMDVSNPVTPPIPVPDEIPEEPPEEPTNQTSVILNPTDDAYVDSDNPGSNYGIGKYLDVEYDDWPGWKKFYRNTYLMFDLSEISMGKTVENAELKLYVWWPSVVTTNVEVYRCDDNLWDESTITWSNAPSYSSTSEASQSISSDNQWYSWDVTNCIQDALSAGKITFVLKTQTDGGSGLFYSQENTKGPELYIEAN